MEKPLSIASYTSADAIPIKLLFHPEVHYFIPIHAQWMPTNSCNLNCTNCSCKNRDKSLRMGLKDSLDVIGALAEKGCKSVTITGGGEPLTYQHIEETIEEFAYHKIKIGLVTNGFLLKRISKSVLSKMTWCRISSMDERDFTREYQDDLVEVMEIPIDWAFSHVVTSRPNLETIQKIVRFANQYQLTHVRLVSDLLSLGQIDARFEVIRNHIKHIDHKVIYQARNAPKPCSSCLIGYIKPVIGPDFKMYLCCGVQYALEKMTLDMPDELCIGSALDLDAVYKDIQPAKTKCVSCYYTGYNNILNALHGGIEHKEFI